MTPLLGTKTPSALVGAKSGGDTRAARSLLSCALWRGMGRIWRGMGGMLRPEPLAAHRPPFSLSLTTNAVRRSSRRLPGCLRSGESPISHAAKGERKFRGVHESRLLRPFGSPWVREGWRHQKPPSGPLPPPASQCFPVHHCSPLFTIVHYCSPLFAIVRQKRLSCASALVPPGCCFPARCGAAWGGYGAAWAAAVPRTGSTAFILFTNHGFFLACCGRRW